MDFARRQLEKYGWSKGKGLGKNENGISEALKPKLKRSVTGIGHDAAAEFNEHWWSALYDKAAKNVEVEDKNGKTKKIKTVDGEDFTITNSTWRINKKRKRNNDDEYSEYFVKKAVMTKDGTKVENVSDSESETEEAAEKKDIFKMTDEELFKACEGRTAHKGARHGLKALGKLARIEQQEQMLLTQTKYEGYSHAKKLKQKHEEIVEDTSVADNQEKESKTKKKKKRKRCSSNENDVKPIYETGKSEVTPSSNNGEKLKSKNTNRDTSVTEKDGHSRKLKMLDELIVKTEGLPGSNDSAKKTKNNKKRKLDITEENVIENREVVEEPECEVTKKKKKKKKRNQTED